ADGAAGLARTPGRAPDWKPADGHQGRCAGVPPPRAEGAAHLRRKVPGDSRHFRRRLRRHDRVRGPPPRRRAKPRRGGEPGAPLAGARRDVEEPGRPHPRGEHAHRADDGEPPGGLVSAGQDARCDLRAAGQHHHRLGRAAARNAGPPRGLPLGASVDRLPRAPSGGAAEGEAAMRGTVAFGLALAALGAVGGLGSSPASRFDTVPTLSPLPGRGGGGDGPPMRIRVAPVTVPEGVNRPQMVRRTGDNTVVIDEFDRWVEPLDALLRNTLVQNLGALVPDAQVLGDAVPGLSADRTVVVALNRLELGTQLSMDAVWFVLAAGQDQPEHTRRTQLTEAAGSGQPPELAPALSRAMEKLSQEIAGELTGRGEAK